MFLERSAEDSQAFLIFASVSQKTRVDILEKFQARDGFAMLVSQI